MLTRDVGRFAVKREPTGSYRVTPITGVWATSLEYEATLAQGAAEALFDHMERERETLMGATEAGRCH